MARKILFVVKNKEGVEKRKRRTPATTDKEHFFEN
jgi:hypothetical protein